MSGLVFGTRIFTATLPVGLDALMSQSCISFCVYRNPIIRGVFLSVYEAHMHCARF